MLRAVPEPKSIRQWFLDWYLSDLVLTPLVWIIAWFRMNWIMATVAAILLVVVRYVLLDKFRSSLKRYRFLATQRENRRKLSQVLASSEVFAVDHVESSRVVEVCTDEASCFVYDIGDGKLYRTWATGPKAKWPNDVFEIVQIPGFEDVFPPSCLGAKLTPIASIEFQPSFFTDGMPDEAVTDGNLDALVESARVTGT